MIRSGMLALTALTVATGASAQGLFRETTPLDVTISTELRSLIRDRDSTRMTAHAGTLTYKDAAGASHTFPVKLKTRGHFRRQPRNCDFPPIRLSAERKDVHGTLFQGNADLKVTTNCRPANREYEQYVLAEYAMYRAYQIVSPRHFRTRLARLVWHDAANATPDVISWGFFVEDDDEVAKKDDAKVLETRGAVFSDLETRQLAITSLFEYMVANTDWSVSGLHNIALMRDTVGRLFPIAYDFDWSGAVNPRYAFPDARLGIRTVTERLYRGPCLTPEQWQPIIARFTAARPRIDAVIDSVPALEPRRRQATHEFLAEFYRITGDARATRSALVSVCQRTGN